MSSQMAPEFLETVDLQAADHVPFTSAAVIEEGQTSYGGSSANYHDSASEDGLLHSAQLENGPMIKVTIWRLLNTIVVLGLGIYKAVAAYLGQQTTPTTLDWVIGVFWAVIGYWVSFLEDAQLGPRGRWFFTQDHSGVVLSILTVPRSIIAITNDDNGCDGSFGSDQTRSGCAPDFGTPIAPTSVAEFSGGSSQSAPSELRQIIAASPDIIEAAANLRRRKNDDDDDDGRNHTIWLNNVAQRFRWFVTSESSWTGPQDNPTWTVVAYVNNVEYGRGSGGSKGSARENASKEVLLTLGILQA
ncbi:hypothetical protein MSAN_00933600 [Mycena sanguinolenta]|uniref:DRBM domain-containing protein n=1 Tax=Mycena sanguinolenta TaxID=230812 RepID=A0A8H6YXY7_9AGAR|nr:hypothetical protein MSAN_00933600 [Mycena sanguinolenta]